MRTIKVDIGNTAYKNVDEISTKDGVSPLIINAYKTETGDDVLRPGLSTFVTLGSQSVEGLYWNSIQKKFYAISEGIAYEVKENTTTLTLGSGLNLRGKVSFEKDATYTFMANGGKIYYSDGINFNSIADAQAPLGVHSLGYLDGYLLAGTLNNVKFSSYTDRLSWAALDFFTPESSPDALKKLIISWREVGCFGEESVDVYYNDGVTPFARQASSYVSDGIIAANTLIEMDNTLYYLNKNKIFVRLEGRSPQQISGAYNKEIQNWLKVDDAFSFHLMMEGKDFYVTTFPSQNITLVYDVALKFWYQWGEWNETLGDYDSFSITSYCYVPDWNKHFVGTKDGKVCEISSAYTLDIAEPIRYVRRTGHIDFGTWKTKEIVELRLKIKRGEGTTGALSTAPELAYRYRKNNGLWSNFRQASLGASGDTDCILRLHSFGTFETIQFEFVYAANASFILTTPLEADIEV